MINALGVIKNIRIHAVSYSLLTGKHCRCPSTFSLDGLDQFEPVDISEPLLVRGSVNLTISTVQAIGSGNWQEEGTQRGQLVERFSITSSGIFYNENKGLSTEASPLCTVNLRMKRGKMTYHHDRQQDCRANREMLQQQLLFNYVKTSSCFCVTLLFTDM